MPRAHAGSSQVAVESYTVHQQSGIIPARSSSAALRQAANLLSELRKGRELSDSHVSTKSVSSASLGTIESDNHTEEEDETENSGDGGPSGSSSFFGSDGSEEEDEDDDEDERGSTASSADSSSEESESDEDGSEDYDDSETESNTSNSRPSSWADESRTGSEASCVTSSLQGSASGSKANALGGASELAVSETAGQKLVGQAQRSRPVSTSKRSVTFLTEAPELLINKRSNAFLPLQKPISRKASAEAAKESCITLPAIGQFLTSPVPLTQSKAELLKVLRQRQKERPVQHAGSPLKPLKTPMQFGPVESMEDEFSWQAIGIAKPYSLVAAANSKEILTFLSYEVVAIYVDILRRTGDPDRHIAIHAGTGWLLLRVRSIFVSRSELSVHVCVYGGGG